MEPTAGDTWFERLPSGWDVAPLRFMARFESGGTPDKGNREFWDGEIPWVSPKDMKVDRIGDSEDHVTDAALAETSLSMVPAGSVLLVVRGMILAHSIPVAVTTAPVTINQDMKALRCSERIEARFLQAVIHGAKPWFLASTGESSHGTKRLETEVIGRFPVPLPPLSTQRAIADYLDAETARIDALIAAKEKLLAILAEKRKALVTEAVTRGLDPSVPMRDSGIPWLGEIPAHWEVVPLRFLVRFESGGTPSKSNRDYWNGDVPWVSPKDMKLDRIGDSADHVTTLALEETNLSMLPVGTVLLVVRGMILAHSIPVAVTTAPVTINQDMKALACSERLLPSFLHTTIQGATRWFLANTGESSHGTKRLETEVVGRFAVPVPPVDEQRSIVLQVASRTRRIDDLAEANRATIKLLQERREAIIAAAVTGQLDLEAQ